MVRTGISFFSVQSVATGVSFRSFPSLTQPLLRLLAKADDSCSDVMACFGQGYHNSMPENFIFSVGCCLIWIMQKCPMDVLLKSFQGALRQTRLSSRTLETFLKALPRFLHNSNSLHNSPHTKFSGISDKWLTLSNMPSEQFSPPLEPAEKVLNVKLRKICVNIKLSVATFRQSPPDSAPH